MDENYVEINENNNPSIESWFQQRGSEFHQAMVILRSKETDLHTIEIDLKGASEEKKKNELKNQTNRRYRRDEDFMFNEFHRTFPGMKKYIQITLSKGKKKTKESEGFIFNDNHFCIFFWILIMLILNLVSVLYNLDVFNIQLNNSNILELLSAQVNFEAGYLFN